jgi:hypothetical protein
MLEKYQPPFFPPSHPFNIYQNVHLYIFGAESGYSNFDFIKYYMTKSIKTLSKYKLRIISFSIFFICYAISSEAKRVVLWSASYFWCKGSNCNNELLNMHKLDKLKCCLPAKQRFLVSTNGKGRSVKDKRIFWSRKLLALRTCCVSNP